MKRIGITGRNGFVGYHLHQTLKLHPAEFSIVDFDRNWFQNESRMDAFVSSCDVIVHLAALNRHGDPDHIYETNIVLVKTLLSSLDRTRCRPHLILSSSTQEDRDSVYGHSKRDGRRLCSEWAGRGGARFTGMVIPNVFGPFGHPFYNSVVATFCHQIARNQTPTIDVDGQLKLIYVGVLVDEIISAIRSDDNTHELRVRNTAEESVSGILALLTSYREMYQDQGMIPILDTSFKLQLFNTFRCYMDIPNYFPKSFVQHADDRGAFVEIARHGIAGQSSFSTTHPGITRGNHFHTRKIERFAVIKGKARIQLRRVGIGEVHTFELDGEKPAYVDMPIWYTHNITNVGDDELYTIFWINEPYDARDPDTWFEVV